jgi:hypothetical protein
MRSPMAIMRERLEVTQHLILQLELDNESNEGLMTVRLAGGCHPHGRVGRVRWALYRPSARKCMRPTSMKAANPTRPTNAMMMRAVEGPNLSSR